MPPLFNLNLLFLVIIIIIVSKKEKILGAIKLVNKPIYSCTKSCVYCIVLCCPPLLVLYDYRVHWIWFFRPPPHPHLIKNTKFWFLFTIRNEKKSWIKKVEAPHLFFPTGLYFLIATDCHFGLTISNGFCSANQTTIHFVCGFPIPNSKTHRRLKEPMTLPVIQDEARTYRSKWFPNYISPDQKLYARSSFSCRVFLPKTLCLSGVYLRQSFVLWLA